MTLTNAVDVETENVDEYLDLIHTALSIYKEFHSDDPAFKVPILAIDDLQMLFGKSGLCTANHDHVEEILEWLVKEQKCGLLDVILCTSAKSVLGALSRCKLIQFSSNASSSASFITV